MGEEGRPIVITLDNLCAEERSLSREVNLEVKGGGLRKHSRAFALHNVLLRPEFATALKKVHRIMETPADERDTSRYRYWSYAELWNT